MVSVVSAAGVVRAVGGLRRGTRAGPRGGATAGSRPRAPATGSSQPRPGALCSARRGSWDDWVRPCPCGPASGCGCPVVTVGARQTSGNTAPRRSPSPSRRRLTAQSGRPGASAEDRKAGGSAPPLATTVHVLHCRSGPDRGPSLVRRWDQASWTSSADRQRRRKPAGGGGATPVVMHK